MRKLDTFFLNPIPRFSTFVSGVVVTCALFLGLGVLAQSPGRSYIGCNHDSLITVLRAYEDSLALASVSIVVRADYAWRVTDASVADKVYKIYRCEALYDSLEVLIEEVAFVRTTPPTVETDSIGSITATGATFYGKVTSDGDTSVTAQWFKYGLSASSLTDSVPAGGVLTPFSAVASGLANGTTYYFAAFAENVKGTSSGDTLSFTTYAAPTVDTDAATSLSATAATLNATIPDTGGAAVTATGFKYGTDAGLTTPTDIAGSGTASPFTASLTSLSPGTQYWAVGYASNSVGTSYGDTITFTTSAAAAFTCGTSTVTYDGHDYTTVQIGSQCWFKENLRNDNYRNGDPIPWNHGTGWWLWHTIGHQVIYGLGFVETNLATYGRLYNGYAVSDARGLCPTGWHVPTDGEWTTLEIQLGGDGVAGGAMKASPIDSPSWDGTNSSGFSALPGGFRYNDLNAVFSDQGSSGSWWTSSASGTDLAHSRHLYSLYSQVGRSDSSPLTMGYSVRCLQDPPTAPTVDTDEATSLTDTAAILHATITATGGAPVMATGFKYGTDAALTSPSDIGGSGTSSPFTAALTGLTASTQYWVVGYASNSAGTSYGDTITFTTGALTCGVSTVTYDGHAYATVQIGSQCWFAENLRNDNYKDGTPITGDVWSLSWSWTTSGAQAVYNQGGYNEATNLVTYGRLYNWFAVNSAAGLCPTGWHVPTDAEWTALEMYLGGASVAGGAMKSSPIDSPAWDGMNSSAFSGLPGGYRSIEFGYFNDEGDIGYWWTSSANGADSAWARNLYSDIDSVYRDSYPSRNGFSVRCVQDPPTAPTVDTDAATSLSATAATLNATITATGGAAVTATGFKYGTDAGLSTPSDIAGGGTSSPFTASLTGLTAATQYWAVGYASNNRGTSYGDTITFTTSAVAPTVDTDAASSVTSSAATLSATITATGGAAVTATGFKYGTDAELSTPTNIAGSGALSPFTASLTGLTAATQYWAVGYASNSAGTSYGDTITFTTSAVAAFTCGTSTVTYDGHAYTTVQIGTQCWFAENLRNDDYRNGDPIPGNLDNGTWSITTAGAQSVYGQGGANEGIYGQGPANEATNLGTYGRLYNWYAVSDARGLCPTGWHVPTDAEWTALVTHLGANAGDQLKIASPTWDGTNSSGFSALPGGYRNYDSGLFNSLGSKGSWWSSSPHGSNAWSRNLYSGYSTVSRFTDGVGNGFSVRCVRDE